MFLWLWAAACILVPVSVKLAQLNGQIDRCYSHLSHELPQDERSDFALWLTELLLERYNLTG